MTHDTNVYLMEALSLVFMFLFGMDMALTVSALTNFAKNFNRIESEINERIASAYEKLDTKAADAIGNMIEKSERIQESAFVRKELAEEKAAALRERLTKERLESLFLSSSAAQKSTLLSIQGFKRSKDGNELRQRMRTMIDEKRHNRQKINLGREYDGRSWFPDPGRSPHGHSLHVILRRALQWKVQDLCRRSHANGSYPRGKNLSKIRSCSASGIPIPVSATLQQMPSSVFSVVITTVPSSLL